MNDELKWVRKEAGMAYLEISLEGLRRTTKNLGIVSVAAEIRIRHLPNTHQQHCR
jgi:hypothetical protein